MKKTILLSLIAISLFTFSSCKKVVDSEVLIANQWKLESLASVKDVNMPEADCFTLSFDTVENRIFGKANCNLYFADYKLGKDNTITINQPGATMMMCQDDNAEAKFLNMIEDIHSFRIVECNVEFLSKADVVLSVFAPYIQEQE